MPRSYAGDPFWLVAKFGECANCGRPIKGKRVFYYPRLRRAYCQDCGAAERNERLPVRSEGDFASCAADEWAFNRYR